MAVIYGNAHESENRNANAHDIESETAMRATASASTKTKVKAKVQTPSKQTWQWKRSEKKVFCPNNYVTSQFQVGFRLYSSWIWSEHGVDLNWFGIDLGSIRRRFRLGANSGGFEVESRWFRVDLSSIWHQFRIDPSRFRKHSRWIRACFFLFRYVSSLKNIMFSDRCFECLRADVF